MIVILRGCLTLLISWALDLALSAANGYSLRTESTLLAGLDLGFLSLLVVPVFVLVHVLPKFTRLKWTPADSPWSSSLLVAWLPIALVRIWRDHSVSSILVQFLILGVVLGAVAFEATKEEHRVKPLPAVGVFLASVVTLFLAIALPLPGRSLIDDPDPRFKQPAKEGQPNLLVIVLDTARADHLSLYGYPRETSPWLEKFSQTATVYDQAVTSTTYTLPAHASLFTGLYTRSHGAHETADHGVSLKRLGLMGDPIQVRPLSKEANTLAEILWDEGLETGAICANSAFLFRYFGVNQGFNTYVDDRGIWDNWRPVGLSLGKRVLSRMSKWYQRLMTSNERFYLLAAEVNRLGLHWLEPRRDQRFFLFLNYMDPHAPYLPIGEYKTMYPQADSYQEVDREAIKTHKRSILPEERSALVDAYDAELRYLDDHLAALFAQLESWRILDNTLVVIVGDHGESLGEHYKLGHAVSVYQTEAHVPLIVRLPGQKEGQRVDRPVHIVDIMPTVLEYLGVEVPSDIEGVSLTREDRQHPVVAYLGNYDRDYSECALYRDPWKAILRSDGRIELYNYRDDPQESRDLSKENPTLVTDVTAEIHAFEKAIHPRFKDEPLPAFTAEVRRRLGALGYVDLGTSSDSSSAKGRSGNHAKTDEPTDE